MIVNFYNLGLSGIFRYPPTEDQLRIINSYYRFLDGQSLLWITRIISLIFLIVSLYLWFKMVKKIWNKNVAFISSIVVLISPTFLILWIAHPTDCLKILFVILIAYLISNYFKKKNWFVGVLFFLTIYLLLFSFLSTKERSSFFHKLGLSDSQTETQLRFGFEDKLTDPVKIPLQIKRITYNKYYLSYKQLINEVIPFFDFETVFFQEVHPMEQKSVVLFYWPEIFLFFSGLYFIVKNKNKNSMSFVITFVLIACINFLFSTGQPYRKFELILFPLSVLIALPIACVLLKKSFWFNKFLVGLITFFGIYGFLTNISDINKRPDFWLDNRPYFYEFVFKSIENKNWKDFDKIYVTSMVGNSEKYCRFYLGKCNVEKFVFDSFDLSNSSPEKNAIYAGFAGEFVGSQFKNDIDGNWLFRIKNNGFSGIETKNIRDTIAYKFGNDVVVAEAK